MTLFWLIGQIFLGLQIYSRAKSLPRSRYHYFFQQMRLTWRKNQGGNQSDGLFRDALQRRSPQCKRCSGNFLAPCSVNDTDSEFLPRLVLCHRSVQIRNSRRARKLSRWSGSLPSFYSCNRHREYKEGFRSRQRYGARVYNLYNFLSSHRNSFYQILCQNKWTLISSQRKHGPADARIKSTLTEIISTRRHKHNYTCTYWTYLY